MVLQVNMIQRVPKARLGGKPWASSPGEVMGWEGQREAADRGLTSPEFHQLPLGAMPQTLCELHHCPCLQMWKVRLGSPATICPWLHAAISCRTQAQTPK